MNCGKLHARARVCLGILVLAAASCGDLQKYPPNGRGASVPPRPLADAGAIDTTSSAAEAGQASRVILVSLDALGASYLRARLDAGELPAFAALARLGSSTLNARADYDYTVTLPNHTSMLTGRPVAADPDLPPDTHHGWTDNGYDDFAKTLHNAGNPNLSYVGSVFDVAHDHGKRTCMYAGKLKFMLFANSYGASNGALDTVGDDDGRNKIDRVVILEDDTEALIATAVGDLAGGACDFAFVHIADLDRVGHAAGWGSEDWQATLERVDGWLARLAEFAGAGAPGSPFALLVTADHGGSPAGHSDASEPLNYTIPFFAVGPGLLPGGDLYALTAGRRANPNEERPRSSTPNQPIRNADAANAALALLGLPPVPGSLFRSLLAPQ